MAIGDLCEAFGVELTPARRARLEELPLDALEALRLTLKQQHT